ncbi:MAG: hypothetical protein LBS21_16120 [Clostridiales bacterium]|jgi:predicted nucleic acid-binding protein|nr:hypothetical protein [Clostridiales bacterium]
MGIGIKEMDALHIACAIEKQCDYFITVDKGTMNKKISEIIIINPINSVMETEEFL